MQPDQALLDEIYRQKILAARKMTPEERIRAGFELTAFVRRRLEDGIRNQFPEANEEEVQRILKERVTRIKQTQERRTN
jgi:hypothetical protein